MKLVSRGIGWFGLYLFLILLPLFTAAVATPTRVSQPFIVELGVGAGFIGMALMCLEFALISRTKQAAQVFGQDALQLFHNLMGIRGPGIPVSRPDHSAGRRSDYLCGYSELK